MIKKILIFTLIVFSVSGFSSAQITSSEVISNAEAYLNYTWTATTENIWNEENCGGKSVNTPEWVTTGDHVALPYCWGGNSSLSQFTAYLLEGKSAGDDNTSAGYGAEPGCSVGVDCSGFVSRCYGLSTHYATSMLNVNALFGHYSAYADLEEADFINNPGSHTRLVTQINANGTITVIESGSGVGNVGGAGLWKVFNWTYNMSQLTNYNPQFYTGKITGDVMLDCTEAVALTCGETYHGDISTDTSQISFYGCNSWTETGPERVHTITPELDGTLKASISNFTGDLDVYILGGCDPSDCLGIVTSNDATYSNAQAGHTYYIVVDSDDGSTSGYDLVVECFTAEDIRIAEASVSPSDVNNGDSVVLTADQIYSGSRTNAELPAFVMEYYLSTDCFLSPDDLLLEIDSSELGSDQPVLSETATFIIPEESAPGIYYILFAGDREDFLNEVDEVNNFVCRQISVIDPTPVVDLDFQQQISIYPNPTHDIIEIATSNDQVIKKLAIYNVLGKLIKEIDHSSLNKMEVSELPAGTYMLEVIGEKNKRAVFRIVKN